MYIAKEEKPAIFKQVFYFMRKSQFAICAYEFRTERTYLLGGKLGKFLFINFEVLLSIAQIDLMYVRQV